MDEVEISAYCYSEKEDIGIGFGVHYDTEESLDTLGTEWIDEGISDSFWENHHEFEDGIEKAKRLVNDNSDLTFRKALYSVLGDFSISYKIEGKEIDLGIEIDINQLIYDMLEI